MSEKGKQSEAEQTAQPSEQVSELTSRLMRRHAGPAGVINTRHPQQLHARTAGWVAQRFAWLDHWRTRYASDENAAAAGGEFTLMSPSLSALREQLVPAPGTPHISRAAASSSPAPPATLNSPMQASTVTAAPLLRVSRRGARLVETAQSPATPSGHSGAALPAVSEKEGGDSDEASDGVAGKSSSGLRTGKLVAPADGNSTPMVLARSGGEAVATPAETQARTVIKATAPIVTASPVLRISRSVARPPEIVPSSPAPSGYLQTASPMAAAAQRKADDASPVWRKGKVIGSPAFETGKLSVTAQTARKAQPGAGEVTSQPVAASLLPLAAAIVQRKAAMNDGEDRNRQDRVQDSSAVAVSQTAAERMAGANPVVKAEIPTLTVAAPPPKMVWRKSANDSSTALPLVKREYVTPSAPVIARQADPGTGSTAGSVTPPSRTSSSAGAVDIERITEQVSRMLARQLAVERERRGR